MKADRTAEWLPEYSRLARVTWHTEDDVTLHNIRNFQYAANGRMTPDWYSWRFSLRYVKSLDLVLSCSSSPHIAHVFLSFDLGEGRRIALTVETRRRKGPAWRRYFRAHPVIFLAGDERDLIGQRLCNLQERVWLYPMSLSSAQAAAVLHNYLMQINQLNHVRQRYRTCCNNGTTNILRYGETLTPGEHYHWQLMLSGHADRFCYERGLLKDWGLLNNRGQFEVLKSVSQLVPPECTACHFSDAIRLPK